MPGDYRHGEADGRTTSATELPAAAHLHASVRGIATRYAPRFCERLLGSSGATLRHLVFLMGKDLAGSTRRWSRIATEDCRSGAFDQRGVLRASRCLWASVVDVGNLYFGVATGLGARKSCVRKHSDLSRKVVTTFAIFLASPIRSPGSPTSCCSPFTRSRTAWADVVMRGDGSLSEGVV